MTRSSGRLGAVLLLLLLPLCSAGLRPTASPPSGERERYAGEVYVALENFLAWTDQARPEELDERAHRFNTVQVPLVAAAVDLAERKLPTHDETAYRALIRWQFWLSKQLDPTNRGMWEANMEVLRTPEPPSRAVTAVLPALEMTQLQSLAAMALRRGHIFDALIWWRDHDLLERKIAHDLFDPVTGGFAQYDSLGRRRQHPENLADLLPIGLGAPTDRGAARQLALRLLVDGRIDGLDDGRARAWMNRALQPITGSTIEPGLDLLRPDQNAFLLSRAVALLQQPKLSAMLDEALAELGMPVSGSLQVDLGEGNISIPNPSTSIHRLERSRVAVEFLRRSHVLTPKEADDALFILKEAAERLPEGSDEIAARLLEWTAEWKDLDPLDRQERQSFRTDLPAPNGDDRSSAFAYREDDVVEWMPTALDLLRRDAAELLHRSNPDASCSATIEPGVVARDNIPRVHLHFLRLSAAERSTQGGWTAAWTDGRRITPATPIDLIARGPRDAYADLPPPPNERGLWWLVLRGPLGAPDHAPACALVEPMRATVQPLPAGDHHTRYYELKVENSLVGSLDGRYEIVTPSGWRVDPEPAMNFTIPPRKTRSWKMEISAPSDEPPGLYPIQWRFYDGRRMVSMLDDEMAIHFRWLVIGPFAPGRSSPLAGQNPPENEIRLGASYQGWNTTVRWHHLPPAALSSEGWVEVGRGAPGAVWYALTAVSTTANDATARVESPQPALLKLNGREMGRTRGRRKSFEAPLIFASGPNTLLVKVVAGEDGVARLRLDLKTLDGNPLRTADYRIEHLLDGYGYVTDAPGGKNKSRTPEALARQEMRLVSVSYDDPRAHSVSVVGTFNGWSPQANPLVRGPDGIWRTEIRLQPGEFQYKLVVDGKRWIPDPRNPSRVPDGFGAVNSVLVVR